MLESEVKVGMIVRVPDHTKKLEPTTSIVRVKRVLRKDRYGKQIYEVEGDATDRFRRPYKWISQSLAEDMEIVEIEV